METTIPRLVKPPGQSFFLFGPRGTGKTTWLKAAFPQAYFIDLLEADTFRSLSARPERLREIVLAQRERSVVVIDEVQKVPELLAEVHGLIEKKIGIRFILTGSSSRKLKRAGVDLLGGRALTLSLHPFIAAELGKAFDLDSAVVRGLIPLVVKAPDPQQILRSYAALYVREEVKMEGLVRNIGNFSRFLEAVSFSHGSLLNVSNVARECEIERKVVESYIGILEDLLLAYRVSVFSKKSRRAIAAHPKFYYFDAGLYRSLRPSGPLDNPEVIAGAALEGVVAQHLTAWIAYRGGKDTLSFWRTKSGDEVDFVVYGGDVFWAIEVKNTGKVRDGDLSALRRFIADYPQCKAFFLYRGTEQLYRHGVTCCPCETFLSKLNPMLIPSQL